MPVAAPARAAVSPALGPVPASQPLPPSTGGAIPSFAPAISRLVDGGQALLRERLPPGVAALTRRPGIRSGLEQALGTRLLRRCERVLALELAVARLRGELPGATSAGRFRAFVDGLGREPRAWSRLLTGYPVLERQLDVDLLAWVDSTDRLLQRLACDRAELASLCGLAEHAEVVAVRQLASDPHRGGEAVWRVDLAVNGGPPVGVVYKPRPVAAEATFERLLDWYGERLGPLSDGGSWFQSRPLVDRRSYGWDTWVAAVEAADPAAVDRFYQRSGALLALLYVLDATDLHCENLIPHGERPVAIDLETLFHPRLTTARATRATDRAWHELDAGALRVGLLPQWVWGNALAPGLVVNALGTAEAQISAQQVQRWAEPGTDAARLEVTALRLPPSPSLPRLGGRAVGVEAHSEALLAGFDQGYRTLWRERGALGGSDGLLEAFAPTATRLVLRPTAFYARLLADLRHPDLLRSEEAAARHVEQALAGNGASPIHTVALAAERRDLLAGDVPIFTCRPGERRVWDSRGVDLGEVLAEPALATCLRRLGALGEPDLAHQRRTIGMALASLGYGHQPPPTGRGNPSPAAAPTLAAPPHRESPSAPRAARLLAAARNVADRLAASAVLGDDDATWIGLSYAGAERWRLGPVGPDLYDGDLGIALALTICGELTAEARYLALARRAARSGQQMLRSGLTNALGGGFSGLPSRLYALAHLASRWGDRTLLEGSADAVAWLAERVDEDSTLDVVGGTAGCLLAALAVEADSPGPQALELARRCARHLLAAEPPVLLGYAHGKAGISHALSALVRRLARLPASGALDTERAALLAQARRLTADEDAQYDEAARNWPDLRDHATTPAFMTAWCHGAPGIVLGRLAACELSGDPQLLGRSRRAWPALLRPAAGANHSLCHGTIGNLVVAAEAATLWADAAMNAAVGEALDDLLADLESSGARSGAPRDEDAPGLMSGLAGIVLGLARLAAPSKVPLVLSLAPPARRDFA